MERKNPGLNFLQTAERSELSAYFFQHSVDRQPEGGSQSDDVDLCH